MRRAKKKKRIEAHRVKPPTPSGVIDAFIEEGEQTGKQKKETKSGSPTQILWTILNPFNIVYHIIEEVIYISCRRRPSIQQKTPLIIRGEVFLHL